MGKLITPQFEAEWEERRRIALEEEEAAAAAAATDDKGGEGGDPPADNSTGSDDDESLNAGLGDDTGGAGNTDGGNSDDSGDGGSGDDDENLSPEEKQAKIDAAVQAMDDIADKDKPALAPEESIIEAAKATDQSDLVALEAQLTDLAYLRQDIVKTHGMSRAFAMEAERIVPGFGGVPMGYYTEQPSATRFRVSLEEIDKTTWGLIAAAAAAVIAIIYKVFRWLTGGNKEEAATGNGGDKGDGKKAEKAVEEQAEVAKEAAQEVVEVAQVIGDADKTLSHWNITIKDKNKKDVRIHSLQQFYELFLMDESVGREIEEFLRLKDPLIADIIEDGKYSKMIGSVLDNIRAAITALNSKVKALENITRRDIGNYDTIDEYINKNSLNTLDRPTEIVIGGERLTLRELADKLAAVRMEVSSGATSRKYSFDSIWTKIAHEYHKSKVYQYKSSVAELLKPLDTMRDVLDRMEDVSGKKDWDDNPGHISSAIGQLHRKILFACAKDVEGAARIIGEIQNYGHSMMWYGRETASISLMILSRFNSELLKNKIGPTPEMLKITDDLRLKKKAISKLYHAYVSRKS